MKTRILIFCLLTFVLCLSAWGQSYSISWFKISGGGGTSTGGVYAVSGTIGQPDASDAMTGGNYSLTGGFWSLISVVQTAGAPKLTITYSGNNVVISWPLTTSFVLQQNPDLRTSNWTTSTYSISTNGAVEGINVASPSGILFFRLKEE